MNAITPTTPKPMLAAGAAVAGIVPRDIAEAYRLAEAIHQSGMAPAGFETPQKIMIAMMAGMELGLPPMAAVQSIAVINNRPCMWGDALIGVVRANPLCVFIKEWIEGEGESMVAHCKTHRKGEPEPVEMTFSVFDAQRAGLWQTEAVVRKKSRDGGFYDKANDSPWFKYPKRMLQMRARAWCLRDVYADVLKGIQVREEIEDHVRNQEAAQAEQKQLSVIADPLSDEPHTGVQGQITEAEYVTADGEILTRDMDPLDDGEPEQEGEERTELTIANEAEWIKQFAKILIGAIGPDVDQFGDVMSASLVAGLSEATEEKAGAIAKLCRAACTDEAHKSQYVQMAMNKAGLEQKDLQ